MVGYYQYWQFSPVAYRRSNSFRPNGGPQAMLVTPSLSFITYIILSVMSTAVPSDRSECAELMMIFGFQPDEMRRLMSSLEYSFENNRKILGQLMKSMDHSISLMDAVDSRNDKLRGVHNEFRRQAMSIPDLWEKNEVLLRYLVSPSNMIIKYGIADITVQAVILSDANNGNDDESVLLQQGEQQQQQQQQQVEVEIEVELEVEIETVTETEAQKVIPQDARTSDTVRTINLVQDVQPPSYDSLEQILVHLCRDWSAQGAVIRERLYKAGIIKLLLKYLPVEVLSKPDSRNLHKNDKDNNNNKRDEVGNINDCHSNNDSVKLIVRVEKNVKIDEKIVKI